MNIIEFLSQNLFFVIIIIGFLLSLLGKGQKQQQQGKGANRMPDFGSGNRQGERRVPPERRTTQTAQQYEQRTPEPVEQHNPGPSSDSQNSQDVSLAEEAARRMEEEMQQRRNKEEEGRRREQQRRAREEQRRRQLEEQQRQEENGDRDRTAAAVSSGPVRPGETLPGANELTSAVLWAEILGPPRAKRPFR
ncbi:hypothetical protein [Paenibacillus daejeonensis]|uniref:hypothetical protein n=1 Tax=Paenibacillus daejeonensis TaxID=135193 RepID=UPI00035FCDD3|nr:hypothetical protein [Paenibacillus daejeonensis]